MSGRFRSYDAFAKPMEGLRTRTATGGFITVVAASVASFLFLSQLVLYWNLEVTQHFWLADSHAVQELPVALESPSSGRDARTVQKSRIRDDPNAIRVHIHVTFPYLRCFELEVAIDGLVGSKLDSIHGTDAILKRPPTYSEISQVQRVIVDEKIGNIVPAEACTVMGSVWVPRVGGSLSVTLSRQAWTQATNLFRTFSLFGLFSGLNVAPQENDPRKGRIYNATHFVHNVEFGKNFPRSPNPLKNVAYPFYFPADERDSLKASLELSEGIGLSSVAVKLVQTLYHRWGWGTQECYQMSVTQHTVTARTLATSGAGLKPGLSLVYDFTPFRVHHSETRENILGFLGNLVGIVGGVFVTVGLVSSCLVGTVAQVTKKTD